MTTTTIEVEAPTPVEKVTPLPLSEAIRLGSLLTRPANGKYWAANQYGKYACALGAATDAYGGPHDSNWITNKFEIPYFLGCPVSDKIGKCQTPSINYDLTGLVIHLNDDHILPREWIADFLESIGY